MESEDVFNINDFTAVTPVEQLSHRIESVINEWNLCGRIPVVDYPKVSFSLSNLCIHLFFF